MDGLVNTGTLFGPFGINILTPFACIQKGKKEML